jgi:hypothetical protein
MAAAQQSREEFWRDYEEKCGEKVLAYNLGQYIKGWEPYREPLWGLVILTEAGFRFHHFAHENWIGALSRLGSGGEAPKEKTIFIPLGDIVSAELHIEKRWWKKILSPGVPRLIIRYRTEGGGEAELVAETDSKAEPLGEKLRDLLATSATGS